MKGIAKVKFKVRKKGLKILNKDIKILGGAVAKKEKAAEALEK